MTVRDNWAINIDELDMYQPLSANQVLDIMLRGFMEDLIKWYPLDKLFLAKEINEFKDMKCHSREAKGQLEKFIYKLRGWEKEYPFEEATSLLTGFYFTQKYYYPSQRLYMIHLDNIHNENISARISSSHSHSKHGDKIYIDRLINAYKQYKSHKPSALKYEPPFNYRSKLETKIDIEKYPHLITLSHLLGQDSLIQEVPDNMPTLE